MSEDKNVDLIKRVQAGDLNEVKSLIESGVDINAKDTFGYTALICASACGHIEMLQLLIENGAAIKSDSASVAFIKATALRHVDVVKLFIEKGIDINGVDSVGTTALMEAVVYGYAEIVKLLLDNGADVHATNNNDQTALSLTTTKKKHSEIVRLLKKAGA